jgi:hypothetical protein
VSADLHGRFEDMHYNNAFYTAKDFDDALADMSEPEATYQGIHWNAMGVVSYCFKYGLGGTTYAYNVSFIAHPT